MELTKQNLLNDYKRLLKEKMELLESFKSLYPIQHPTKEELVERIFDPEVEQILRQKYSVYFYLLDQLAHNKNTRAIVAFHYMNLLLKEE